MQQPTTVEAAKWHRKVDESKDKVAASLREKFQPKNMQQPIRLTIVKDTRGDPASAGVFMTVKVPGARKLQPGEVVVLDLADEHTQHILASGAVKTTQLEVTRPVVFESSAVAKRTRPDRPPGKWTDKEIAAAEASARRDAEEIMAQLMGRRNGEFANIVENAPALDGEALAEYQAALASAPDKATEADLIDNTPRRRRGTVEE